MDETTTRLLTLTGLEVVFLVDSISTTDLIDSASNHEAADAKVPGARTALLVLASSYLEVVNIDPPAIKAGPVYLAVTEEQAWLFRTKVRTSSMAIDKSPIGPALSCKLLELLLLFRYSDPNLIETPSTPGPIYTEADKQELEAYYARIDADPYEDYGPHNGTKSLPGRPSASMPGTEGTGDSDNSAVSAGLE